ncbi:hypothetical protein LO772_35655 [Yinghuangia sp. ASG 101]|uniref:hypothetical protein n=1 Tax=Yinghuangia sp. ASG 101 TaxID=2896848 RepID=UPI001E36FDF8|nr:hypothetical protein [Yinghuangia sp. ASG 101]UGQ12028.1 hypothetical protein LO772_35655 [Yinghuangia sp. ASG 101]
MSPARQRLMYRVYRGLLVSVVLLLLASGVLAVVAVVRGDDEDDGPRQEVRWAVPALSDADFARAVREHYLASGRRELTVLATMSDAEIAAEGRTACERKIADDDVDSVRDLWNRRGGDDVRTWEQYVTIVDRAGALMCPYYDVPD